MSIVDSNNKEAQATKTFNEKKQMNDKLFVDLCYKELYAVIDLHISVMKYLDEVREKYLEEDRKKVYQIKEEESAYESIQAYNDAIKKIIANEIDSKNAELLARLKALLDEILNKIEGLKSHIYELNIKISELTKEIVSLKKDLAKEIEAYFTKENINIRSQTVNLALSTRDGKKENIDFAIDNDLYFSFTQLIKNNLDANNIQFNQLAELARKAIIDHIVAKNPQIPDMRQRLTDNKAVNNAANQLVAQFTRDISKNPAIASKFSKGCQMETELEKTKMQLQLENQMLDQLESMFDNTLKNLNSNNSSFKKTTDLENSVKACKTTLADIEEINQKTEKMVETTDKADHVVNEIKGIAEEAKEDLVSDPATPKLQVAIDEIEKCKAREQEQLEAGCDFLSNDEAINPEPQSKSPSQK